MKFLEKIFCFLARFEYHKIQRAYKINHDIVHLNLTMLSSSSLSIDGNNVNSLLEA